MSNKFTVALIGSPNVGKSSIFNRIVGKKISIIDNEPGVTRDRIYENTSWLGVDFSIIDTGGIELDKKPFQEQIRVQAQIAIKEADVIVFVVDGKVGLNTDDKYVAKLLFKSQKPVILAVNKIDSGEQLYNINEFYALGFKDIIPVSGIHGIGVGDLLDKVIEYFPKENNESEVDLDTEKIVFSIIGRPNVGKSSLLNKLIKSERSIVSNIEGTTRDCINSSFFVDNKEYLAIDTAGIKKSGQIYENIDKYALLRAMRAIEDSNICLLVIDGNRGLVEQDKHVLSYAFEKKKAVIIVVNKWDLVKKEQNTVDEFTKHLRKELKFVPYAPIIYVSALTGSRVDKIFELLNTVNEAYKTKISTSLLNRVIRDAQMMNEAPDFNGGRLKITYVQQVGIMPPKFALFVNNPSFMHFSYQRYLENRLRDSFNLDGTPIDFVLRKK